MPPSWIVSVLLRMFTLPDAPSVKRTPRTVRSPFRLTFVPLTAW